MSEEENIKRPQATDDPQGPESGQEPEEIIPAEENVLPKEETVATELPTTNIKLQTVYR